MAYRVPANAREIPAGLTKARVGQGLKTRNATIRATISAAIRARHKENSKISLKASNKANGLH
jgi:hypothetical protein